MKKTKKVAYTPLSAQQKAEVYYKLFQGAYEQWELARRTHFSYLIIGTILGCGLTLIGIGIGLWTGVI